MTLTTRTGTLLLAGTLLPLIAWAQAGPSGPQVIAGANTPRINVGQKKLEGHLVATVRVGEDGRVRDVLVTENTTGPGFESQLVKVLQAARFRPAIDESGRLLESSLEMKVELLQSTGTEPKPVPAKPDPDLTEHEKARIKKMRCADFLWEWELIRDASGSAATEYMPRLATSMYATMRNEAGDYVDAKVWKEYSKGLKEAADQCEQTPEAPFWDGIFKSVMDQAVSD